MTLNIKTVTIVSSVGRLSITCLIVTLSNNDEIAYFIGIKSIVLLTVMNYMPLFSVPLCIMQKKIMLSVLIQSVTVKPIMLNVIMLIFVILSAVFPIVNILNDIMFIITIVSVLMPGVTIVSNMLTKCHNTECIIVIMLSIIMLSVQC